MKPDDISVFRQILPETMPFPYYPDRESAWRLSCVMTEDAKVASLRDQGLGSVLSKPLMKPLVARCGGVLLQRDVVAIAHADRAPGMPDLSDAGRLALDELYAQSWYGFELSFSEWGVGGDRNWCQMSRRGGNLVVQLAFPPDHAELMGRFGAPFSRKDLEYGDHPIRQDGRPTLAWARLDIDLETGTALIEEVQSDWLRFAKDELDALARRRPHGRELTRARAYEAGLRARYGKLWPKAMLLAVLCLLRDEFAIRDIWMHQPGPGAILKGIRWSKPPVSLYTSLPKSFGFVPTREAPGLLTSRRKDLAKLRRKTDPLFWRLQF